ncbi:hypothetical protein BJ875DRAFT_108441 [Amylocarpus encephaloides]|uniref:Uncharacterized protein n=1 Tax=Amylocarpus encephaloides TaxID=45428 RepID=A0A9P8C902_9HELO|nr:hypothetical protein BJ875DRAFT_108441 [Amylocarpus encephaloides]
MWSSSASVNTLTVGSTTEPAPPSRDTTDTLLGTIKRHHISLPLPFPVPIPHSVRVLGASPCGSRTELAVSSSDSWDETLCLSRWRSHPRFRVFPAEVFFDAVAAVLIGVSSVEASRGLGGKAGTRTPTQPQNITEGKARKERHAGGPERNAKVIVFIAELMYPSESLVSMFTSIATPLGRLFAIHSWVILKSKKKKKGFRCGPGPTPA